MTLYQIAASHRAPPQNAPSDGERGEAVVFAGYLSRSTEKFNQTSSRLQFRFDQVVSVSICYLIFLELKDYCLSFQNPFYLLGLKGSYIWLK